MNIYFIEPLAKSNVFMSFVNMIEALDPPANNNEYTIDDEVEDENKMTNNNCIDLWSSHRSLHDKQNKKTQSGSHTKDELQHYLDKPD